MFKMVLEKAEEPEITLPTSTGSSKKQESSRKNIYFCFIDYAKAFDYVDHNTLENSERAGNTRPMQQSELDMEHWGSPKLGKEYVKAVYCHLANLISMQSTSQEIPGWMNHKLESRLPGETSTTSDMQMTPLMAESEEELKSLLMRVKEESERVGLRLNIKEKKKKTN